jgi:hypothetical protein
MAQPGAEPAVSQYFGAGAAPPAALQDDLPLPAGAAELLGAAPPPALHELLPPADGLFASGVAAFPPPQATVEPISIPATADTARALAMFITLVSSLLSEERLASAFFPAAAAGFGATCAARLARVGGREVVFFPGGS